MEEAVYADASAEYGVFDIASSLGPGGSGGPLLRTDATGSDHADVVNHPAELAGDRFRFVAFGSIVARQHEVEQGVEAGDLRILLEQDDMRPRLDRAPALVGIDPPGDQPEQSRFAGAVTTDQRQPVALADI